jgi:HrpA-like RNA helicase
MDDTIDVKAFLSRAIDPPKLEAMDAAWSTLVDLGAVEGEKGTSRLTALGRHMSMIPVDLRLAKMLVLGAVFKCLDPGEWFMFMTGSDQEWSAYERTVLTVASLLSSKPLFTSPLDRKDESRK